MTETEKQQRIAALKKLFLSDDYLDEAVEYKRLAAKYALECVESFKQNGPEGWEQWKIYEGPGIWLDRIIPYFEGNYKTLKKNVALYKAGEKNYLSSSTHAGFSYSKMYDGIGWDWWKYVDEDLQNKQTEFENKTQQWCANIYYTLIDRLNDEEMLDTEITGPIDEARLAQFYE